MVSVMQNGNKCNILQMEEVPCSICKVKNDELMTILGANSLFYRLFGYSHEEAEALGFTTASYIIYKADWIKIKNIVRNKCSEKKNSYEVEVRAMHANGSILWVLLKCCVDSADPALMSCIVLDVTEKMERMKTCKEEFQLLLNHTGRFVYRFYLSTRIAVLCHDAARELAMPVRIENLPESHADYPAPESRNAYFTFYDKILRGESCGSMTVNMRNYTGSYTWYHFTFSMVYNSKGDAQHALITFEDVGERREKELAYKKWSQYYQSQVVNAVAYYECNLTQNSLEQVDGSDALDLPDKVLFSYEEIIAYVMEKKIYEEDKKAYSDFYSRKGMINQFQNGKREVGFECRRLRKDGSYFWTFVSVQLLPDPYSSDTKAFILIKNIDKEKRAELKLRERSEKDALTGVLNRGAVVEQVNKLLERNAKTGRHALIMVDIDCFKELNDRMGHQFGDEVLRKVAKVLKKLMRPGDIVGRMGGDEFVVCMQNIPLDHVLIEKADTICNNLFITFGDGEHTSASVGISVYSKDGDTFDELYRKSDIALYEAKRLGRNRCVFYKEGMGQLKVFHKNIVKKTFR